MNKTFIIILIISALVFFGYITNQGLVNNIVKPQAKPSDSELDIESLSKVSPDSDDDGIKNIVDNCPFVKNPDQLDKNSDGIGDVCYVIELAKEDLAKRLGGNAAVLGIGVVQVEDIEWPDSCLGVYKPEIFCALVKTPGYKLTLQVSREAGQKYLYHTDKVETFLFVGSVD